MVILFLFSFITPTLAESIDYKKLYSEAAPAVVLISGISGETLSRGTGSIISDSGLILTNAHVAANGQKEWEKLIVTYKPSQITGRKKDFELSVRGSLFYLDRKHDLALILPSRIPKGLKYLQLSDLKTIGIGEPVVAIGHPGGGQLWTMTTGFISASWVDYKGLEGWDLFQTETPINPGNSGGPLLAGDGSIVGVNTFVIRSNKRMTLTGLNYAIKATTVTNWLNAVAKQLMAAERHHSQQRAVPKSRQPDATPQEKRPTQHAHPSPPHKAPARKAPIEESYSAIKPPEVKKSNRKYTSELPSGIQMTEEQLLSNFLEDIDEELSGTGQRRIKPDGRSKSVVPGDSEISGPSESDDGLDNFLDSIED